MRTKTIIKTLLPAALLLSLASGAFGAQAYVPNPLQGDVECLVNKVSTTVTGQAGVKMSIKATSRETAQEQIDNMFGRGKELASLAVTCRDSKTVENSRYRVDNTGRVLRTSQVFTKQSKKALSPF